MTMSSFAELSAAVRANDTRAAAELLENDDLRKAYLGR